ncbi:MAG: SGNH/GDSL hydrolase family protein, partial [Solirubrobacteraceae bacterium]
TPVEDTATLSGEKASSATGTVAYSVYANSECTELVATAGEVNVTSGVVPSSVEKRLPTGTYYWQAVYSGGGVNKHAASTCGKEILVVTASTLTTSLTGEGNSGLELEVQEKAPMTDAATIHGPHAKEATGTVKYAVYSDKKCTKLYTNAGEVTVSGEKVPSSSEETLPIGVYYWQASYSGDSQNPKATSTCGAEVAAIKPANSKYAALGDSYSSGEGTKTATNTYYAKTSVAENECHRSPTAYPVRVAEALYPGEPVGKESEVFKQKPPKLIFRACSGAVTENLWDKAGAVGGQYNEWIEGAPGKWLKKPSQDLWLQEPGGEPPTKPITPNKAITWITATMGGNDAGFATIGRNCVQTTPDISNYTQARCKEVIKEWATGKAGGPNTLRPPLQEGIPSLATKIPIVLENMHESAPNARIRVLLYPQPIDTQKNGDYNLGESTILRSKIKFTMQKAVAVELNAFVTKLNDKIEETVDDWAEEENVDAEPIVGTAGALTRHQIGDTAPWINSLVFASNGVPNVESFHPKCEGQIAFAQRVLKNMKVIEPKGGWEACEGPSWYFEGSRLGKGEEKAVTLSKKGGNIKIRSTTGAVKLECTGASGSGDIIGSELGKTGMDKHKLELTGCTDVAEKECEIISLVNKEKEAKPAGQIGPVSIGTELEFLGNTNDRETSGDLTLPLEENTAAKFGAGAPEKVFVVIELKEKAGAAEECKERGKRFSLLAAAAGGPAAELMIAGKDAKSKEQAESIELRFPATPYTNVEKWTGFAYKVEPIEFQWINEAKVPQRLELEGTLVMTIAGKKFGWIAG